LIHEIFFEGFIVLRALSEIAAAPAMRCLGRVLSASLILRAARDQSNARHDIRATYKTL
jgi:hypothetical protein